MKSFRFPGALALTLFGGFGLRNSGVLRRKTRKAAPGVNFWGKFPLHPPGDGWLLLHDACDRLGTMHGHHFQLALKAGTRIDRLGTLLALGLRGQAIRCLAPGGAREKSLPARQGFFLERFLDENVKAFTLLMLLSGTVVFLLAQASFTAVCGICSLHGLMKLTPTRGEEVLGGRGHFLIFFTLTLVNVSVRIQKKPPE